MSRKRKDPTEEVRDLMLQGLVDILKNGSEQAKTRLISKLLDRIGIEVKTDQESLQEVLAQVFGGGE